MELGFRAPFSCPPRPEFASSPPLTSKEHASSVQLTLNKLNVNPKEIPITTGPSDRRPEINSENLILSVSSVWQPAADAFKRASGAGQLNYSSNTTRDGWILVNLQNRCSFFLKFYVNSITCQSICYLTPPRLALASGAGLNGLAALHEGVQQQQDCKLASCHGLGLIRVSLWCDPFHLSHVSSSLGQYNIKIHSLLSFLLI